MDARDGTVAQFNGGVIQQDRVLYITKLQDRSSFGFHVIIPVSQVIQQQFNYSYVPLITSTQVLVVHSYSSSSIKLPVTQCAPM